MTGKNVLNQQLKTGNVDMPSPSGALKESGAVSIELNIFPEHPEETSGSPSEKTETGRGKKGNADKGMFSTGDEQEKQATTTKKEVRQTLQTGNVNMSSESGALKKSGAVRVVRASIHERPKKTRGSISEEKNRLSQDTLQQEIREMRIKNPLKQQLKTGNVNSSSESGALKKSGAVRIVRASIHERPKKKRGSLTEEKNRLPHDTLQQEIRERRTKNSLKQQLKTGNANAPLESEALKKSEAVDFVLITIHGHPKGLSFFWCDFVETQTIFKRML